MQYLKNLLLSRPYLSRIADQSVIKSNPGNSYVDLVYATRDQNNTYAMVYLPQNNPVKVDLSKVSGRTKKVWWFDVRTGVAIPAKSVKGNAIQSFVPPKEGRDWVLVIDDAGKSFKAPGEL